MSTAPVLDDDEVWRALAHPLRRSILDQLRDGPRMTGELVDALGVGRHLTVQHLAVLRDAGLVIVEPRGRQRLNHLNAVPIQRIYDRWVAQFTQPWVAALVGLERAVEERQPADDEERHVG